MKTLIQHLIFILSNLFFLNTIDTNAQCHIDDWTALKAFYESTNGDNWFNRTGWDVLIDNQDSPPANCILGDLHQVNLDKSGRVEGIGLIQNGLTGTLPAELGKLINLTHFDLSWNKITGNIPPEIGNLKKLEFLDIERNDLTGSLPSELGNMTNLMYLILNVNKLTGSLPSELGNLNNLGSITLDYNQLTGNIPPELGNLSSLYSLGLSDNQLTGNIPPELGNLGYYLQYFRVSNNSLSGCYDNNLAALCAYYLPGSYNSGDENVSNGNNFDASWEDFCEVGTGTCIKSCEPSWVIANVSSFLNLYESNSSITTYGYLTIEANRQVVFRANEVTLNQGFSVKTEADFIVQIGGCD